MERSPAADLIALLDGGTTRTRLRLWDGRSIVWQASRAIGARDVAKNGRNGNGREDLVSAVADLVAEARAAARFDILLASGMIGSNVGLSEVPQLVAPVAYAELASAIVPVQIPSIGTIHFIPGIRTVVGKVEIASISRTDVMRGEETEIVGLRRSLQLSGHANFFHAGSHHKFVRTDDKHILSSTTALSGEILNAVMNGTILASSVTPLAALKAVDMAYWMEGLQATQNNGFARAAFCVRLIDQLMHVSPEQATAYLLGTVAALDLQILDDTAPLFLYGHLTITEPLAQYLSQQGKTAYVVPKDLSESAAAAGAANLWRESGKAVIAL